MNLPNLLTSLRILLVPVFVIVFTIPSPWTNLVCAGIFAVAAVTDWLDGWIARARNQQSRFGAFLDSSLVHNFVLVYFLGICPFLGVSTERATAVPEHQQLSGPERGERPSGTLMTLEA